MINKLFLLIAIVIITGPLLNAGLGITDGSIEPVPLEIPDDGDLILELSTSQIVSILSVDDDYIVELESGEVILLGSEEEVLRLSDGNNNVGNLIIK